MAYGISIDIGTSGSRAHAVDLDSGKILSTSVTECHPLPGANIMDHLTFCINVGTEVAHKILIDTENKLIKTLGIDLNQVEKVSICGNPIQLSLFQGIPVDDLAFAGENAHHIIEATFKAAARALREAVESDPRVDGVPSTKGSL